METDVVHIRPARPKDASALADVYAEAWRGAYRGIIPHLSLERMIARRGERWWKAALAERRPLLVLDFDGAASGYVTYGRCRSGRAPFQGEIFELYLHPVYQGLGLGEKLFERVRLLSQPRRQAGGGRRRAVRRHLVAQGGVRLELSLVGVQGGVARTAPT